MFDLDKIKFAADEPTFKRAVALYESGKVTKFKIGLNGFSAVVLGSEPYHVFVSSKHFDQGDCDCYLGQNDTLCKHMVAVAIWAATSGKALTDQDKQQHNQAICSGHLGELSKTELSKIKQGITAAMRYIKSYEGPSRTWFAYQDSLTEGCNRLSAIVSDLPVSLQTARLLIDLLLRLDKKLSSGGVDDSDGTVGGFIEETVGVLKEFTKLNASCLAAFTELQGKETCFGWEEPLVKMIG